MFGKKEDVTFLIYLSQYCNAVINIWKSPWNYYFPIYNKNLFYQTYNSNNIRFIKKKIAFLKY